MKCPFFKYDMFETDYYGGTSHIINGIHRSFRCKNNECLYLNQVSKYIEIVDINNVILQQEYILDSFYVKVFSDHSRIYRIIKYMLIDEIRVPRALWLNIEDMNITLTTIKTFILFS